MGVPYRAAAAALLLLLLAPGACVPAPRESADARLLAVATTSLVRDVVERVGGEHVRVISLMGPGVDPHQYKASEGDVRRLFRADVIFYNGLHLEARMGEVLERMGERTRVVALTSALPQERLLAPPEFEGSHDPHVWFDVALWAGTVEAVRDALAAADPARSAAYAENAARYAGELTELDAYVRAQAARIPPERRVLVTAHDAFNYFGRAYGFDVHALQGISTAAEAGTGDVQALADFIATRRIPAIFVETSVPERTLQAVREAVRARGFDVVIGGALYSDALGTPGTPAGSYTGMVRSNIDTIVGALLGQTSGAPTAEE